MIKNHHHQSGALESSSGLGLDLPWSCFFLVYFDDNVVASGAARAHIRGDNAQPSLPWLIAVHVTPSEAPPPLYLPSANLHLIMSICAET